MSNYTNENLINIPPSKVPVGTLAMKVGDTIFTAGSINMGGSTDFYKCTAVFEPQAGENYVTVTGAGTSNANGTYSATSQTYGGATVYRKGTSEYYLVKISGRWSIVFSYSPGDSWYDDYEVLYYQWEGDDSWDIQEGTGPAPSSVVWTVVESDSRQSWNGKKAVLNDGVYSFQSDSTSGLEWSSVKPVVGNTYSADALIKAQLYLGIPQIGLLFYAPLSANTAQAQTGQSLSYGGTYSFSDSGGIPSVKLSDGTVTISNFDTSYSSFTLSMWINMTSVSGWQNLFGTGSNNNLNAAVKDGAFAFWGGSYTKNGSEQLSTGHWYFVCGCFESNVLKTYINGTLSYDGEYTKSMQMGSTVKIGKSSDNCNGRIAAVRFYDRVLSTAQIQALYNQFAPTT